MSSRRWIPVLASVLVLVTIGGGVLALLRFAPELVLGRLARYKPPVVIAIEATYPGANAAVVAQTVAIPIEQQVNGVENMVSMSSQCSSDGRYVLQVTFRDGTDPNVAQMLMQNRSALSAPALPMVVQQAGLTVRKVIPQPIALLCLTSPDNRYDALYLSNFAAIQIQPELARVPGVGEVIPFGARDPQYRLLLEPGKLAQRGLTASDVLKAMQPATMLPGPSQLRFTSMDQFEHIILKASPDGELVRMRDVARIDPGAGARSHASFNGQTTVVLAIYALPDARASDVSRAIAETLAELRTRFPPGFSDEIAFDFAPVLDPRSRAAVSEHVVIDVELPAGSTPERTRETLDRAADVLKQTPGVKDVLALTEHPLAFVRSRPCLIVGLTPKSERTLDRTALAASMGSRLRREITGAEFRFSLPSTDGLSPVYGFPIEFVIDDRDDQPASELMNTARAMVEQMEASGKFTDVDQSLRGMPYPMIDVDQARCQALGVDLHQVFEAVQLCLDPAAVGSLEQMGRTWQVQVAIDGDSPDKASRLQKLHVKNQQNELVPLAAVASVRETIGHTVIERHNLYPAARVTANIAPGVPLAEARKLCESIAARELGMSFNLVWLSPGPRK